MSWFYKYVAVWFQSWWYPYLFAKRDPWTPWHIVLWCRLRGHPCGMVFYNPGGTEPDYHCKDCGDEIG